MLLHGALMAVWPDAISEALTLSTPSRSVRPSPPLPALHAQDLALRANSTSDWFMVRLPRGVIHVHHIVPLSKIGAEYKLDPIKDLIPLCPNCHAVVHLGSEVMSIEKLKEHLAEAKRRSALTARPHGL